MKRKTKMIYRNILHPKYHLHIIKNKLIRAWRDHIEYHANRQIINTYKSFKK